MKIFFGGRIGGLDSYGVPVQCIYIYILWSVSGINIFYPWGMKIFFVGGV